MDGYLTVLTKFTSSGNLMEDVRNSIFILVLGWLLGTLSPAIVDAIKSKREAELGRAAVDNELKDLASVLLAACFRVRSSSGKIDRPFLEWLKLNFERDADNAHSAKYLVLINTFLAARDQDIAEVVRLSAAADSRTQLLQKYPIPLLDFRMSAIQSFSTDVQVKLLQIRRNVSLLDAIVDQSREFYRMTFTPLANGNHELVRGNLNQSFDEYVERAKIVIDQIHELRAL